MQVAVVHLAGQPLKVGVWPNGAAFEEFELDAEEPLRFEAFRAGRGVVADDIVDPAEGGDGPFGVPEGLAAAGQIRIFVVREGVLDAALNLAECRSIGRRERAAPCRAAIDPREDGDEPP